MKKALLIVSILIILVFILHLVAPKHYQVERKIVVSTQIDTVFKSLCSLKEQQMWSPWAEMDPNMKVEYRGVDGQIGSVSHWVGNDDVGEGEQEVTKIEGNTYIETELRFLKPFESTSVGFLKLKEVDNQTEVTWGFYGENKFPTTIIMLFMNIDKQIGPDFEKGLAKFKTYIEK
ncbi:polyketide cyclase [Ancylomarina salipaludis]|uniref:Polyketide cyclase n=1 Tax=Ancylomarina salipaludis TaxID=2501299 RepID=A0A4Q1JMD5_9BACT|nr:SRPBCC family protein [Ancylomarina salipaludis]RXQ95724.1 polyketide cyclase [Ancylomarina salipaludis]